MTTENKRLFIATSTMALLAAGCFIAALTTEAEPHEAPTGWSYPFSCCSGYDCRPVSDKAISERSDGYHVPSGEVVGYRDARIRQSPDGNFHWCSVAGAHDGRTICLFVPPRGM